MSGSPHIKIASLTLPPDVQGEVKGELVVCIEALHWNFRRPPQQVQVRLKWWGGSADTVVPFHTSRGAGAAFAITSGPRYLSRYLKDMGSLVVGVEECPGGRTVGTISIGISHLDVCKPIEASVPCYGSKEQLLATADVSLRVHYTQLMSSFEMNEHLATTDKALPLYPVPTVPAGQPASAQAAATAATATVPGLPPQAPGKENAGHAGKPDTNSCIGARDGSKPDQQQQQQKPPAGNAQPSTSSTSVAAPAGAAAEAAAAPGAGQHAAEKLALCSTQDRQPEQQHTPELQATAAEAAGPTAPVGTDPLLDIVKKAEQLKQAMDQAAKRGITLALPGSLAPAGATAEQQQQQQRAWPPGLFGLRSSTSSSLPSSAAASAAGALLNGSHGGQLLGLPWHAASAAYLGTPAAAAVGSSQARHTSLIAALLQGPPVPLGVEDAAEGSDMGDASSTYTGSQLTEMEDLEELEDLLLQELFNTRAGKSPFTSPARQKQQQQQQQLASPAAKPAAEGMSALAQQQQPAAAAAAASEAATAVAGVEQQPQQSSNAAASSPPGPQLQVELLGLSGITTGSGATPAALTAVLKSAGHTCCQLDVTSLLQDSSGGCCCPCSAVITGPSCLAGPLLATDRPCLAVEVWSGSPSASMGSSTTAAGSTAAAELLGIVRVPLQEHSGAAAANDSSTTQLHQPCFAAGTYPVYDVLRGRHFGSVELRVVLAEGLQQGLQDDTAAASHSGSPAAAAAAAAVVAVRHVIDVTVHSASHLPDEQQLETAGQLVPESRFMRYSFPGEEPLFTQEVACVAAPVFAAHAQHTVLLPPGQSVADCLCEDEDESLGFEVWDKWQDDSDSLIATGSLPLQQVLQLSQVDHPATAESSNCMRTFLVQLQLAPGCGEAAAQPQGRAVLLQVTISYTATNCYSLDDAEDLSNEPDRAAVAAAAADVQAGEGPAAAGSSAAPSSAGSGLAAGGGDGGGGGDEPPSADAAAVLCEATHASSLHSDVEELGSSSDSSSDADEYEDLAGMRGQIPPASPTAAEAPTQAAADQAQPYQLAQAAPGPSAAAAAAEPKPMSAELCVEIIRACGLQAAVKDAEVCLGGGSGLLGRAHQLGPHPYATLSLFPGGDSSSAKGAPAIKTPFQAQTFCPQFHHQQVVPLTLDSCTLHALATQECSVQLWHHCPRSQAVAAALSRGHSSSYAMAGQQQVFLGSASCSLQGLLTRPQGVRSWLVLKSQLGQPVGAVQVALQFTHIAGTQHDTCPAAACPLSRYPQLLQLLPASAAAPLLPLLAPHPESFQGQLARVSVHIEELLLPGGDDVLLERPKIANYVATYRLPGSQQEHRTHSKSPSSQQSSSLLARSWRVDWQHCGRHWVVADWRLARALLAYPLQLSVAKQEPSGSRRSSSGGGGGKAGPGSSSSSDNLVMLPLGSVDVDLSPLLQSRPGTTRPGCKWLSGVFAVVHPMSKTLGNTRLRLKVLLDLQPAEAPPEKLLSDSAAYWEVAGPLAALPPPVSAGGTAAKAIEQGAPPPAAAAAVLQQQQGVAPDEQPIGDASTAAAAAVSAATASAGSEAKAEPSVVPQALGGAAGGSECDVHSGSTTSSRAGSPHRRQGAASPSAMHAAHVLHISPAAAAATAAADENKQGFGDVDDDILQPTRGTRLRAEISHASAPAAPSRSSSPAVASRSISPAAALRSSSPLVGMQLLVQQPAQQQVQPQQLDQQQQQQWQEHKLSVQSQQLQLVHFAALKDVRVCVEGALNLQLPHLDAGWEPCLYVAYHWQETGSLITTPLVAACCGPMGQTASAKWFHCVHLPLALQQRQQPDLPAATAAAIVACSSAEAGPGAGQGPTVLLLQVWVRALPFSAADELPPLYAGIAAVPAADDMLLGAAVLDLSALHVLGSIEGWYNINEAQQELRGQIKVSLTPLQQLDAPPRPSSQPAIKAITPAAAAAAGWPLATLPTSHSAAGLLIPAASSSSAAAAAHSSDTDAAAVAADSGTWGASGGVGGPTAGVAGSDGLLWTLRANLKELDELSASLVQRVWSLERQQDAVTAAARPDTAAAGSSSAGSSPKHAAMPLTDFPSNSNTLPAPAESHTQLASSSAAAPASAAAEAAAVAGAARAYAFRNVQTLSDDEEFLVAVGGPTDSDTDTEELMGRVDWSLAQNSDDEGPPGPPPVPQASVRPADAVLQQSNVTHPLAPLNQDDWMFNITRPMGPAAAAAAATPSSSSQPVNPAQLSQSDAAAATAAAAARLAEAEAARADAAAAQAAAARRQAAHHAAASAAADTAAAPARNLNVWQQLAEAEDEEEERLRRRRQQQQQAVDLHDPRQLPEDLNARLDDLLASYQAAASGPPPDRRSSAAAAAAAAPGPPSAGLGSIRAAAASVADRALHASSMDDDNGDDDGDFLPAQRVVYSAEGAGARVSFANSLPPVQDDCEIEYYDAPRRYRASVQHTAAAAAQAAGSAVQRAEATAAAPPLHAERAAAANGSAGPAVHPYDDGLDDSNFLPAERVVLQASSSSRVVAFANSLPPVQDDFVLHYSDRPLRLISSEQRVALPAAVPAAGNAAAAERLWQHPAASSAAAHPAVAGRAAAVAPAGTSILSSPAAAGGSGSSSASHSASGNAGFVPVVGQHTAEGLDDMFSIRRSGGSSSASRPPLAAASAGRAAAVAPAGASTSLLSPPAAAPAAVSSSSAAPTASQSGFVPVIGRHTAAGLDDMFSFRRSGGSSRSSSQNAGGGSIRHPGM